MKSGFLNPDSSFGKRLEFLMEEDGIAIERGASGELSRRLYERGILKYNSVDYDAQNKERDNARNRIDGHRKTDSAENISGNWLKTYCDYFRCSADYLFGYIELSTHEKTNIKNHTGLSEDAINKLFALYNTIGDGSNFSDAEPCLDIINGLLSSKDFMRLIRLINNADLAAISIRRHNIDLGKLRVDKNAKISGKSRTIGGIIADIEACCASLSRNKYEIISLFHKLIEIRYKGYGNSFFSKPLENDFTLSVHQNIDNLPLIIDPDTN